MLETLSPARKRFVLLLVLAVLVGALVATAVLVGGRTTPVAQDDRGPVMLVAGYGGATLPLRPVRDALEESGRDVVVLPSIGDNRGDIKEQARRLDQQVDAAMERFDASSVDVVGYSAGGVVARTWIRDFGGASKARRVLTIGSPHHGTTVADQAAGFAGRCPTACEQMRPDSPLIAALNARDETPRGPRFIAVWSTADQVVLPVESASLEGALSFSVQSICPESTSSHGELPGDPVVRATLESALGTGDPTKPTGVTC